MKFTPTNASQAPHAEKIAIVGMAFQLPGGARDRETLWEMLCAQRSGITEIPQTRFATDKFYDPDPEALGHSYTKWAGILPGIDQFDPKFFGIAPREAASMDPQQRLVLQTAREAIEDARISLAEVTGQRTGVFVGVSNSDYKAIRDMSLADEEKYAGTGYAMSIVANRVSHRLNLTGPSFSVDTACSSSLVALDAAVRNLQTGTCEMALVAGVNVVAHPGTFVAFSKAGMLSPTGELSTFDAAANGYVRGEGVGVVMLKPVTAALRDGNHIHAVIEATAVNQDGQTSTMTAPSPEAQMRVIGQLFAQSGRHPSEVGYAEAHGTGTPVGDPIEAGSIGQAIGRRIADRKLLIGSIKPNIGHLESAAGIAGLIKAVLATQKQEVPPNYRFNTPNPAIPLDVLNLQVPTARTPFPAVNGERRAIVNSFGFGGTNASVLIASAPDAAVQAVAKPRAAASAAASAKNWPVLIPLSGATPEGLAGQARALLAARQNTDLARLPLTRLAAALAAAPELFAHRAVILCRNEDDLISGLEVLSAEQAPETLPDHIRIGQVKRAPKLVFTFSGQGNQAWDMARDLLAHEPVFRAAMEEFDAAFAVSSGWSILSEMAKDEDVSHIHETWVTQPALVGVQYGLSKLWAHWGVTPDMVLGHSVGEVTASVISGGVTLETAMRYLAKRSTIQTQISHEGAMAAVALPPDDVEAMLPGHGLINIGGRNGPGATTISGDKTAVAEFVAEFEMNYPDTFIRQLKVDSAWHSYQLEEAEDWLRREVGEIAWSQPVVDFVSTVTGKLETRLDLDYCWQNLRQTVRYSDAVEAALDLGGSVFLEIGPHTTLKPLTTSVALEKGASIEAVSSLSHKQDDLSCFATAAAELFIAGVDLNWGGLYGTPDPNAALPGYAWDNEAFWQGSDDADHFLFTTDDHPLLGIRDNGPADIWVRNFNLSTPAFLKDHRYMGEALFPAAGYVDVMLAAGRVLFPDQVIELEDVTFHKALFLPTQGVIQLQTVFSAERGRIVIMSRLHESGEDWEERASALLRPVDVVRPGRLAVMKQEGADVVTPDPEAAYAGLAKSGGVAYGPAFATIRQATVKDGIGLGRLSVDADHRATADQYVAHPTLLDGCLQSMFESFYADPAKLAEHKLTHLPTGIARVRCFEPLPAEILINSDLDVDTPLSEGRGQIDIADPDSTILLSVTGLRAKEMPNTNFPQEGEETPPDFIVEELDPIDLDLDLAEAPGRWIVLGEETAQTTALMAAMQAQGAEVARFGHAELGDDITDELADMLIAAADADDPAPVIDGVVFAWPLSAAELAEDAAADAVYEAVRAPVQALVELGVALHDVRGLAYPPRVVIATRGARATAENDLAVAGVVAAPLAAAMRTLSSELPEISLRHVDMAEGLDGLDPRLAPAILCPSDETEVALRRDAIYGARLKLRARQDLPQRRLTVGADDDTNFKVTMTQPGVIDRLDLFECPRPELAPDEVRIKVRAVGLNFRDIMAVTALLPEEAEPEPAWQNLGLEFAGDIVEVGADVRDYAPGDRVMGMGRNCLQRFHVAQVAGLIRMHDTLTYDEAVTIPSAFATAYYALMEVGRLAPGERVLIHVATGGVGLAAVQMAQAVGAEIFATAGSDAKRAVLRDLGVAHVMNSRSLDYADEVMALTDGAGVDVILNSLPGSNIDKGLDILAPYGRFLEIGKRDVYADHAVGMRAMRRNQSFNVIDLAAMGEERPDLLARQMNAVMAQLREGALKPLPTTCFALAEVTEAFRYMSQAQHVGKVVITLEAETFTIREDRDKPITLRGDGSYLVTGGTRGFTLSIADWMSRQGAGKLILASRSGKVGEDDLPMVEAMRARGTQVQELALDVTDPEAVATAVQTAAADPDAPLAGIMHGAAVIKDTLITMLTPDVLEDVLRPKVIGGWALHRAEEMLDAPLDFIIGFSSVAQAIGSLGQYNYVAGNFFLDALAEYRKPRGGQGGTMDWGVIADSGFVARDENLASYLETAGMAGVRTEETEFALATLMRTGLPRFCYARGDWVQVGRANTALGRTPRFAGMISGAGKDDSDLAKRLAPLSGEALVAEIASFVTTSLSELLKVELGPDDIDMPMSNAGLDSLSSFELKMQLETELGISIMASHFLKAPTISELSAVLAQAFEAERDKSATVAVEGEAEGGSTASATLRAYTDAQAGLIAASVGRFTSGSARRALELRCVLEIAEDIPDADIQQAIYALFAEYPLIGLTCDIPAGDVPLLTRGEAPRLSQGHLEADQTLNVAQGVLLRFGRDGGALQIVMHRALGDAVSLETLSTALQDLLADGSVTLPADPLESAAYLSTLAYQPETPQGLLDRAFWDHCLRQLPAPVQFANRARALGPETLGFDHGPAICLQGGLAKGLDEAAVLRAYATALRQQSGSTQDVLIARDINARPDAASGGIGPFTLRVPVIVPVQLRETWQEADFKRLLAATPAHLAFDLYAATQEFSARFDRAGARPNQISFAWDVPDLGAAPAGCIADVHLEVCRAGKGLAYRFTFDADVVPEAQRDAILAAFEAHLAQGETPARAGADAETIA